jgi:Uma2 family endonuclease
MQILERTNGVSFSPLLRRYSLEEFWALPEPGDRSHYDLIGGQLFMVPPPDPPHGSVDSRLNRSLVKFLNDHNLGGELLHPREGIYKDPSVATYLEPDMMYVSDDLLRRSGKRRTSADIVFEYSSKSTASYDQTTKADTYLALGVRELWLIDSDNIFIEVGNARLQDNQPFWETRRYESGESADSEVLNGWRVSVDELFAGLI